MELACNFPVVGAAPNVAKPSAREAVEGVAKASKCDAGAAPKAANEPGGRVGGAPNRPPDELNEAALPAGGGNALALNAAEEPTNDGCDACEAHGLEAAMPATPNCAGGRAATLNGSNADCVEETGGAPNAPDGAPEAEETNWFECSGARPAEAHGFGWCGGRGATGGG